MSAPSSVPPGTVNIDPHGVNAYGAVLQQQPEPPCAPCSDEATRDGTERILLTSGQIGQLAAIAGRDDEPVEDQTTYVVERCATGHSGPGVYAHLDEYPEEGAFYLDGAWPERDAPMRESAQEPKSARLSAKPLTWKEEPLSRAPDWREWVDQRMGFHISYDPEEDAGERYIAAWGEGDPESFATVEEAKAWCQEQADSWVREIAVASDAHCEGAPLRPVTDEDVESAARSYCRCAGYNPDAVIDILEESGAHRLQWEDMADTAREVLESHHRRLAGEGA